MPSIKKVKDSYKVTISNGYDSMGRKQTVSETFTPKPGWSDKKIESELNKFAYSLEERVKSGENVKADKVTVEKLSKLYLKDMEPPDGLEKTTYYCYKQIIECRLVPILGQSRITNINGHAVKNYTKYLRTTDGLRMDGKSGYLSEGTIKKDIAILSSMLSYAVSEGLLTINPLIYSGKCKKTGKKKKEYVPDYLTIEQTQWLLWAMDNVIPVKRKAHTSRHPNGSVVQVKEYTQQWQLGLKWRFFFYLSLFTGDRRGENISFTWEDLDFQECTIDIKTSTARDNGEVYHKDTKTHATRLPVVPKFVMDVGLLLYAEQKKTAAELGDQWLGYRGRDFKKNWVFTQWNGKQMDLSSPRQQFKKLIEIYNKNVAKNESEKIPSSITLHDLRHTAASILISNNMDPRSVAGILGHKQTSTTLNIYAYFFRSKNIEASNIMQNVLFPDIKEIEPVAK